MRRVAVAFSGLIIAAACGGRAVAFGDDAGADDAPRACLPIPNPFRDNPVGPATLCGPDGDKKCQAWAESLTTTGFAHTTCDDNGGRATCVPGDRCVVVNDPRTRRVCMCDRPCIDNEMCVSDTANGPAVCRTAAC